MDAEDKRIATILTRGSGCPSCDVSSQLGA